MTADNTKKIAAKKREGKVRAQEGDLIPAVVYGAKRKSMPITIDRKDFFKLYKEAGESTLISLEIDGEKESPSVLIYEIQKAPLTGDVIHVDFFEPNLKEEVEAEIPLQFVGESPAVKELSGTLIKNFYSVNVKALPQDLPHEIEVDISELETLDDVIYIKDLKIASNAQLMHEDDSVVAMVSSPEDVEAELEKPIEEGEEPEVIGEEEKEEDKEEENKEDSHQEDEKEK